MHNHSENWRHLTSILIGYATTDRTPVLYSFTDHTKAKALSIFLAHATLATPKLDRTTVEAVLAGQQRWPHTLDTHQFKKVNLPLSLLEECGLVAFYTGWCTVHCQTVKNLDNVDPSLIQLIQAVEHLKDIRSGKNGYIQPHYTYPANELRRLAAVHFGSTPITELLPELCLEDGHFMLPPDSQNFNSLVSTYLWRTLRESLEPKQAFERWILCLRVNCNWGMPVLFDDSDFEERTEFGKQLIAYLSQDAALSNSMSTLRKQFVNKNDFSNIIIPVESRLHVTINPEGNSRSEREEVIELEKTTLTTLSAAYPTYSIDDSGDLQFVQQGHQFRHWREPELFYTSLVASVVESSIRIDGHVLVSSGIAEALLELAVSRPILKYLLLNLLPEYESATYLIWLLSRPATCDIALFYLTQRSFANLSRDNQSFTKHFDKGYQQLVCHEYLRTIEEEPDSGDRLLKVVELLGNRFHLQNNDFSKSSGYQFLICLLGSLGNQHVIQFGQAFAQGLIKTEKSQPHQSPQHHWYLIGFWLIERLEDADIDPTGTLSLSLKAALLSYYTAEFAECLAGHQRSLQPSVFFFALPWHKLIGPEGVRPLLILWSSYSDWQKRLSYSSENSFAAASAVRHYLQVLMCVGQPQRVPKDWTRIADRVAEIVRTLGFGPREQAAYLFGGAFYADKYDLWSQFCSYINLFQDSLYDDFVERCVPRIPLDKLFVLLERCPVIVRAQQMQEVIGSRQSPENEDLGLFGLERAFLSAWEAGHTVLVNKLILAAKAFMAEERFTRTNNPNLLRVRKVWLSYEYKWQLANLLETLKHQPDAFAQAVFEVTLPHERQGNSNQEDDQAQQQECERFRRYIIAAAHCETNPEKCVCIMEVLYKETKNRIHSFLLFKGRLALHGKNGDATRLRPALLEFLLSVGDTEPEHMSSQWVASILDTYRQLHDAPAINVLWMKLTPDQQATVEILRPYCQALIARGEALSAQQIITRYRELNPQMSEGLEQNDLIDELCKALPHDLPITQLVQMLNEDSQRSAVQLAKHYSQIVSKEFEDYVAIVGHGQAPHEFLKNAVLEVARELLLRKKNLQIHLADPSGEPHGRITKEDLINDWFTSLFDQRMAEARIGMRDQKRGGQSVSGKGPGEIDGYITSAKNKRIAIFEAFRLFSNDKTVISEHLDKIAGYDNESLSPVFIAAYCDVSDFAALVRSYAKFIASQDYVGFTVDSERGNIVEVLHNTVNLWIGMEQRRRHDRKVIFYHLLLDMSFSPESSP